MKEVQLDEVFEFVRNGASIKQEDGKGGYPISRIETIWNKTIDTERLGYADVGDEQLKDYEKYLMKEGDILMTHINSPKHLGKCAVYIGDPKTLIHGMNLLCLRANQQITIPTYIKYFFDSKLFKAQLPKISNQSVNQASFSASSLKKLKIPLPPLDQQKKIAAILDAADAYRQKTKALIEKYDKLTQSLFLEMFGDPVKNPKGFEKSALGSCIEKVNKIGKSYSKDNIQYVDIGSIDNIRNIITKTTFFNTIERPSRAQQILLSGDIIFSTVRPNLKNIAINYIDGRIGSTGFFICRTNSDIIINLFLFRLLLTDTVTDYFVGITSGANYPAVNSSDIKKFQVIIPPLELQNQFAERVQAIEEQKAQAKASLAQAEDLFNSLLQRAFKGKLTS